MNQQNSDRSSGRLDRPDRPDRLDRALAALPPRAASERFTQRVLAELDALDPLDAPAGAPGRGGRRIPAPVWALAAAVLVTIAAGFFLGVPRRAPSEVAVSAPTGERETLRLRHGELVKALESARSRTPDARPVLYLGAGGDVDYVLDLSPLIERPVAMDGVTRPAALTDTGRETRYY